MTQEMRFPEGVTLTLEDFQNSGWQEAVAGAARERYSSMHQALSAAAEAAGQTGDARKRKALWLLADATSMRLVPSSVNEPFRPLMIFEGKRSALPEDFGDADILLFEQLAPSIELPRMQARLADLVWLRKKPRAPSMALTAIDAYLQVPLDEGNWFSDGRDCWSRALSLARMLGPGAGSRADDIQARLLAVFRASGWAQRFFAAQLAEVMRHWGLARTDAASVAAKLEEIGAQAKSQADHAGARGYFAPAASWYANARDGAAAARLTAAVAETWVDEAQARSHTGPGQLVASAFLENAIQTYRTIAGGFRAAHNVAARIEELRRMLSAAGQQAVAQMTSIRHPGVDISEMIHASRQDVAGKPVDQALAIFCACYDGPDVQQERARALESLTSSPLAALGGLTMMSGDGRVIAKRPALGLASELSASDEVAVWEVMVRNHLLTVALVVQGQVMPTLEVLTLEHRLREDDFIALAASAPIIPKSRARIVGKGLHAGYDSDFVTALHILVPQLEHLVRHHVKQSGGITTHLDQEGVETENGLSTLMAMPLAAQVFGESLCFEIKALFCSSFGPNLRNNLAHGLLSERDCLTAEGVYAWWFMFRLVFSNFWNTHRSEANNEDEATPAAEGGTQPPDVQSSPDQTGARDAERGT